MLEKINGNIENLNSQKWQETKKLVQKIRPTGIGGTDANKLVHGETWLDLYNEKLGHTEPVDLSNVLPVQMGIHTEDLNRRWFMKQNQCYVTTEQTLWYNDYIYGTVDGIVQEHVDADPFAVFEAKHTHAFNLSEKKQVEFVNKYYPQVQHYMLVTKYPKTFLSVFFGNMEYRSIEIQQDKKFQAMLLKAHKVFWKAVQDKDPIDTNWKEFHGILSE
ncbi:YqaJ viral recombinase family protein [Pelagibacteraceae bacterium]|nr:YqaJ viral recombinase family protein [Pelagibacteraceae bacterium]